MIEIDESVREAFWALRERRHSIRASLRDVAPRAKVSYQALCMLENGKLNPRLATYLRVEKALDQIEAEQQLQQQQSNQPDSAA